jgi:glycine/D-amino acid oxidase-like deaminating enzyme
MPSLPPVKESYWRESASGDSYPELRDELSVDVAIVGGGITGLTAAYLLKQSGLTVAVIEKRTVGSGTTGRTTGKVSSQHSIIYSELSERLGQSAAKMYGQANQAAVGKVEQIISQAKIGCDWRHETNYVYTTDPNQVAAYQKEALVAAELGLPASFTKTTPLPFEIFGAVSFAKQGTFHAQKYVSGLAATVNGKSCHIFENSNVIGIRDGVPGSVRTKHGKVIAKHIIVATNVPTLPLMARGGYCLLEYPTESYIVAGYYNGKLPGMYISTDESQYSILPVKNDKNTLLLIGGEGHISGVRLSPQRRHEKLAAYGEKYFGIKEYAYAWSDRDYIAYDGMPLVGKAYPWSKNLYVASAFRKWGLTNGTAAAMILHDLILGIPNEWAEVFTPQRLSPIASIPRVAKHYVTRQK